MYVLNRCVPVTPAAFQPGAAPCQFCVSLFADPNKADTDDGVTPIYIAAMEGHVELVTLLLKHNADPNQAMADSGQTTRNQNSKSKFNEHFF